MRLDVFKYIIIGMALVLVLIVAAAFFCSCTMYSIKMDHPEGTEFDNTDKRTEQGAKSGK